MRVDLDSYQLFDEIYNKTRNKGKEIQEKAHEMEGQIDSIELAPGYKSKREVQFGLLREILNTMIVANTALHNAHIIVTKIKDEFLEADVATLNSLSYEADIDQIHWYGNQKPTAYGGDGKTRVTVTAIAIVVDGKIVKTMNREWSTSYRSDVDAEIEKLKKDGVIDKNAKIELYRKVECVIGDDKSRTCTGSDIDPIPYSPYTGCREIKYSKSSTGLCIEKMDELNRSYAKYEKVYSNLDFSNPEYDANIETYTKSVEKSAESHKARLKQLEIAGHVDSDEYRALTIITKKEDNYLNTVHQANIDEQEYNQAIKDSKDQRTEYIKQETENGNKDGVNDQQAIVNKQEEYLKQQKIKKFGELQSEYDKWKQKEDGEKYNTGKYSANMDEYGKNVEEAYNANIKRMQEMEEQGNTQNSKEYATLKAITQKQKEFIDACQY
ncbi:MAG: hypothetical protein IKE91_02935 [Clostridia bacterium]|nr:hypothetical protein [Clostridia bacterium]